ncbi:MAG: hypothetical protein K9G60_07365 [Pseudolabrys sp.]|nr:hypothetical protein [Pseudolabrys sp.]
MSTLPWKTATAGALLLAGTAAVFAAQLAPGNGPASMPGQMHEQMHGQMMHGQQQFGQQNGAAALPTSSGQDAFGAIQEIVQILEADPTTDWTKVNIAALREHLIDMNEVTLRAKADARMTETGIEIVVTGAGRTRDAIKRMVPAHVHELARLGWSAGTSEVPDGVKLTVTANNAAPLAKLKALGFIGIMVQGGHHQPHHLMMAKGAFVH